MAGAADMGPEKTPPSRQLADIAGFHGEDPELLKDLDRLLDLLRRTGEDAKLRNLVLQISEMASDKTRRSILTLILELLRLDGVDDPASLIGPLKSACASSEIRSFLAEVFRSSSDKENRSILGGFLDFLSTREAAGEILLEGDALPGHGEEEIVRRLRSTVETRDRLERRWKKVSTPCAELLSSLESLEDRLAEAYLARVKASGMTGLKAHIRNLEEGETRKVINRRFRSLQEEEILRAIEERAVSWERTLDRSIAHGAGLDERIVEFPLAFEAASLETPGRILDAGATLNSPYISELTGRTEARIVHFTQSSEGEACRPARDRISYVFGDLRSMEFKDATFDKVLCISTLEHVGMDNTRYGAKAERAPDSYLLAVKEMVRVVRPGGRLVFTFPYGREADLGWYRVFGAEGVRSILRAAPFAGLVEKYYYYDGGWYEGGREPPESIESQDEITGLCALLIEKAQG